MIRDKMSLAELTPLIAAENERRKNATSPQDISDAERELDAIFGTNSTLAVYGTLAPGRQNYHIVEPLGGDWTDGFIEGDLQQTGWGATLGYPAFRPRAGGPILKIRILKSPLLPDGWKDVDDFEGPEYIRILIPVFHVEEEQLAAEERQIYTVANLYAARD
ncbi:MAG: hypothetical protein JST89_22245 [Cyanobacteria bacterium SZAS-4]|nr:hypothetical protein [Cyanobacteria bacterium SZAS-4]